VSLFRRPSISCLEAGSRSLVAGQVDHTATAQRPHSDHTAATTLHARGGASTPNPPKQPSTAIHHRRASSSSSSCVGPTFSTPDWLVALQVAACQWKDALHQHCAQAGIVWTWLRGTWTAVGWKCKIGQFGGFSPPILAYGVVYLNSMIFGVLGSTSGKLANWQTCKYSVSCCPFLRDIVRNSHATLILQLRLGFHLMFYQASLDPTARDVFGVGQQACQAFRPANDRQPRGSRRVLDVYPFLSSSSSSSSSYVPPFGFAIAPAMGESSRKRASSLPPGPGGFIDSGYYRDPFGFLFGHRDEGDDLWPPWPLERGSTISPTEGQAGDGLVITDDGESGTETHMEPTPVNKGKGKDRANPTLSFDVPEEHGSRHDERPATPQTLSSGSSRATSLMGESETDFETDRTWLLYPPPDALREIRDIPEEYREEIQELITESLSNLAARAAEEQQHVREDEEAKRRRDEEEANVGQDSRRINSDGEPYLPVIVVEPGRERGDSGSETSTVKDDAESSMGRASSGSYPVGRGLVLFPVKQPRKRRYNLSKLLHRMGNDKAEPSGTGGARHVLRSIYHHRGGSKGGLESSTHDITKIGFSAVRAITEAMAEARERGARAKEKEGKGKGKEKENPVELVYVTAPFPLHKRCIP
jgi:hypothetical protein